MALAIRSAYFRGSLVAKVPKNPVAKDIIHHSDIIDVILSSVGCWDITMTSWENLVRSLWIVIEAW